MPQVIQHPPKKLLLSPSLWTDSRKLTKELPHRSFDRAQLLLFVGKRGNGKTFALQNYVSEREPRVFVLDPFEDFRDIRRRDSLLEALDEMQEGTPLRRRVVPPINEDSKGYAEIFFVEAVERLRNCLIVLDEVTLWSDPKESKALQTLILQGRRLGLRFCVATQRLSLVPGVFLSECTELLVFKTTRPRDLDVLDQWAGKEVSRAAPGLDVGECYFVSL